MPVETINGTSIAFDVAGEGDPLLLIHGSWSTRQPWAFLVPLLAESHRVVSYDRRGHGESTADPEAGTVHDDVADAVALIEHLDLGRTHVVANSYGGCIALRLAGARPDLVRRLACHEPPLLGVLEGDPQGQQIAAAEWRKLDEVRAHLERGEQVEGARHFVERVALGEGMWEQLPPPAQDMFTAHAGTFLGELRDPDALRPDSDTLSELSVPVLITNGQQSPPFFAAIMDVLSRTIPDVRTQRLAGVGHVPHFTHPGDYATVLRRFFQGDRA